MNLSMSNGNYTIIESHSVLLFSPDSDLTLRINATSTFSFTIILKFIDSDSSTQKLKKEIGNNSTLIFEFSGLNSTLGSGSATPIPIATVGGQSWYLHVWSYLMGNDSDGKVRKVEYTIYEENQEVQ